MNIEIINKQRKEKFGKAERDFLCEVLNCAGEIMSLGDECEVSIAIVGDKAIRQLNKDYRNKDSVTDVLSFALEEGDELLEYVPDNACEVRALGDIIIAASKVVEQAEEYGHSVQRELAYLAVHGLLHLLGYDHECEQDKMVMRAKEEEIMSAVGVDRKKDFLI